MNTVDETEKDLFLVCTVDDKMREDTIREYTAY